MTLVVYLRIGRVDIFGGLFLFREHSSGESQHPAADTVDGEHHPATEPVVRLAIVLEDCETGILQHLVAVAVGAGMLGEGVPFVKAVTQTEGLDDTVRESTVMEIGQTHGDAILILVEQCGEIFLGEF